MLFIGVLNVFTDFVLSSNILFFLCLYALNQINSNELFEF